MPKVVVVDIDGTISNIGDREKYLKQKPPDWDKFYESCFEDDPIDSICALVRVMAQHCMIVYLTGRREKVRDKTERWLQAHNLPMGVVRLMRDDDNKAHDVDVKPNKLAQWLKKNNLKQEDVLFIIEDRNSVVAKWRELGYTCIQPALGDF